jgi:hypothetical protein
VFTVSSDGLPIRLVVMFINNLVDLPSTTPAGSGVDRPTKYVGLAGQTFNGTQRKLLNLLEEFDPGSD